MKLHAAQLDLEKLNVYLRYNKYLFHVFLKEFTAIKAYYDSKKSAIDYGDYKTRKKFIEKIKASLENTAVLSEKVPGKYVPMKNVYIILNKMLFGDNSYERLLDEYIKIREGMRKEENKSSLNALFKDSNEFNLEQLEFEIVKKEAEIISAMLRAEEIAILKKMWLPFLKAYAKYYPNLKPKLKESLKALNTAFRDLKDSCLEDVKWGGHEFVGFAKRVTALFSKPRVRVSKQRTGFGRAMLKLLAAGIILQYGLVSLQAQSVQSSTPKRVIAQQLFETTKEVARELAQYREIRMGDTWREVKWREIWE